MCADVLLLLYYISHGGPDRCWQVLANYRCTPYPEALATWMREKATELGRFADYVYRQPSAEGELFTVRTATVGRHELLRSLQFAYSCSLVAGLPQQVYLLLIPD